MITSALFSDVRHRAMITPPSPLIVARVTGQFIIRLKLLSKWELSIGLDFKSNVQYKSVASKKHSVRYKLCFKWYLFAYGSSGSNGWARVKRERTKSRERLLRTILFYSGPLQH